MTDHPEPRLSDLAYQILARTKGDPVRVRYRNYRGEESDRIITPVSIWWGQTEWHPVDQWMLKAFDHGKNAERDFAMADVLAWGGDVMPDTPTVQHMSRVYSRAVSAAMAAQATMEAARAALEGFAPGRVAIVDAQIASGRRK